MDKDLSDKNKEFQKLITKEATFKDGIKVLLELRDSLFEQITQIVNGYPKDAFWIIPFAGAEGYHSKTLAYSIWHVLRIEDIVLHTLILNNSQVLEKGEWQKKIGAEIITTGNELSGQQISDFSKTLDGVVPAEQNITLVLLQPVPQMEYALTQNAARKKVLTVAGNVQKLKAVKFRAVAAVEKRHEERYRALLNEEDAAYAQLKDSSVKIWECLSCGHIVLVPEAPEYCPTCDEHNAYTQVTEENYDLIRTWG